MGILYANEKMYNPISGLDELAESHSEVDDRTAETMEECTSYLKLAQSPGWKFLTDWIEKQSQECSRLLDLETDYEKIRRYQEARKVYRSILSKVKGKINERELLKDLLNKDPE